MILINYLCNVIQTKNSNNLKNYTIMATTRRNDLQGFNTGKSLSESINDVMKEQSSRSTKRTKLIKLGLRAGDIEYIFSQYATTTVRKSAFDFSKLTFGVEIECYNCDRTELIDSGRANGLDIFSEGYNHRDNKSYFKIVSDGSLTGENSNEVVSPILKGKKGMNSLKALCKALESVGARVNRTCGLHVHIGASAISDAHYCRLVRNYQKIERVIDSFMPESRRADNNCYCRSLSRLDFSDCNTKMQVFRVTSDRYYKVNMAPAYARHRTIEFRQHSGTTDYEKISNWVMFLTKLVEYSYEKEITACERIEDIPFLTSSEKNYFINRREALR